MKMHILWWQLCCTMRMWAAATSAAPWLPWEHFHPVPGCSTLLRLSTCSSGSCLATDSSWTLENKNRTFRSHVCMEMTKSGFQQPGLTHKEMRYFRGSRLDTKANFLLFLGRSDKQKGEWEEFESEVGGAGNPMGDSCLGWGGRNVHRNAVDLVAPVTWTEDKWFLILLPAVLQLRYSNGALKNPIGDDSCVWNERRHIFCRFFYVSKLWK